MLVEKEVIRPGCYWYRDERTGEPRKLTVTPELTKYWHEQGNAMLAANLTVPVPCEHDFDAHPMTPKDKLLNNAGWVRGYRLSGDRLISDVEIEDEEVYRKLPKTIRWTSPWINSFTDGAGKEWKNVISHLALTTRPRIINQEPFGSVAAALSMAEDVLVAEVPPGSICLSRAGLLRDDGLPAYPIAFSLVSGIGFATAHDPASGQFTSGGTGHAAVKAVEGHHKAGTHNYDDTTREHSTGAVKASKKAMRTKDKGHHAEAAEAHEKAFQTMRGVVEKHRGTERAGHYRKLALAHESARDEHHKHVGGEHGKYSSSMDIGLATEEDVDAAFAWSPQARAKAAESRKRNAATRKTAGAGGGNIGASTPENAHTHSQAAHDLSYDAQENSHHSREAMRASSMAHSHSSKGNHQEAAGSHHDAAGYHVKMAQEHHAAGRHMQAHAHAHAAAGHFSAAKTQLAAHDFKKHGVLGRPKKRGKAMSAAFAFPPPKAKSKGKPDIAPEDDEDQDTVDDDLEDEGGDVDDGEGDDDNIDLEPIGSPEGDVSMVELLCDLLGALGIQVQSSGDEEQFKRDLYNAAMTKIHEMGAKGDQQQPNRTNPPGQPPNNPQKPGQPGQPNPLVQQEQQPMFMSLEEIKRLDEPLRSVALSMHAETQRARSESEANKKKLDAINAKTLAEAQAMRAKRVAMLGRLSPKAKPNLDAMLALPAMALSIGDGGEVVDPMATTLQVLEAGLADMPRLLTTDAAALTMQQQPSDETMLDEKRTNEIADSFARAMGCPPEPVTK